MSNDTKSVNMIWLIPLVALLFILVFAIYTRGVLSVDSDQPIDYGTREFVPAQSPYSTGPNSR